jgi:hypothetical protein
VSVHNRKHFSELNLNTLWSFQSDAVTHRFWPGLKMLGKRATVTEIQAAISLVHHIGVWMENIIIKISDKIDDSS